METFDTLWDYCKSNKRVVPRDWNKVYQMLDNKGLRPSGQFEPSLPFTGEAAEDTLPIEKQSRFKEHIVWADENDQIEEIGEYLRSLDEEDWYHFGEI